jgi:hypothetical protein
MESRRILDILKKFRWLSCVSFHGSCLDDAYGATGSLTSSELKSAMPDIQITVRLH